VGSPVPADAAATGTGYRANSGDRPREVGGKRPNRWGLYDVEGNVWEWSVSRDASGKTVGNRRGGSWPGAPLTSRARHF
jgi:sulfatase modifying factor 1